MSETFQQYVARINSYLGDQEPLAVIEKTPERIAELVKPLSAAQIDFHSAPGKWSIRQQVAHLADTEMVMSTRMRWAAAEPGKGIVAFDQDKWAATGKYASIPLEVSLAALRGARAWTVAFLKSLTAEEKQGYIQHEERGREALPHLMKLMAGHDLNHLRQISELAKHGAGK